MRIYLWSVVSLYSLSAIVRLTLFVFKRKITKFEAIEAIAGAVTALGLYGYLSGQKFLFGPFWFFMIVISLGFGVYGNFFFEENLVRMKKLGFKKSLMIYGTMNFLLLPHLYFLFEYARSF